MADVPRTPRAAALRVPSAPNTSTGIGGFSVSNEVRKFSGDAVQIDPRGFVAEAGAAGAIGEGMQNVGSAMGKIAADQFEHIKIRQVADARDSMKMAQAEISAKIAAEPDETKWEEIARTEISNRSDTWNIPGMSPDAAEEVRLMEQGLKSDAYASVKVESARQSKQRAAEALNADRITAAAAGNYEEADRTTDFMVEKGVLAKDKAAAYKADSREQGEKAAKLAVYQGNFDAIQIDPDAWLKSVPTRPEGMDPVTYSSLRNQAEEQSRQQAATVAGGLSDAMVTGQIKDVDDIERAAAGKLSPSGLAKAKAQFFKMRSAQVKAYNNSPEGLVRNTGWAESQVDDFDPAAENARDTRILLETEIKSRLPEGATRNDILKDLEKKWNPSITPPNPDIKTWASTQMSNWYKDGKFGNYRKREVKGPTDAGYYPGTKEEKWVTDPAARDAAWAKRGQVAQEWRSWLEKNPEPKVEDAQKAMKSIVSGKLEPADVDALINNVPSAAVYGKPAALILQKYAPPALPEPVPPQSAGNDAGTDLPSGGPDASLLPLDMPPPPTKEEWLLDPPDFE